ncbi:MAG: TonB-dependent receptor [Treponema sp.]|jgi:vitamin B12 transporter|nr:TonB-dependent receptor [Treponema sp.]
MRFFRPAPFLPLLLLLAFPFSGNLPAQESPGGEQDYGEEDFYDEDLLLMEGEGLTVVGTTETTQQMAVISREEIEQAHAPDIPALLEEKLSLGITRYGSYGNMADVNIRGFDTERVAILVDGVPVNSNRSGEFDFNQVDINAVERIEVVYGGSDTKYNVSGALGGVLNIITIKKEKPGFRFGGGFSNTGALPGRYNTQYGGIESPQWQDLADAQSLNIFGAYGAEKNSFRVNLFGNRAGNHFLYQDYYGYARRKEGNEVWDLGASLAWARDLGDYSTLVLSADTYYGDKNIPLSGYTAEKAKEKDFSVRQNVMLDMPRFFRDDLAMEASVSHGWQTLNYDPGRGASLHKEQSLTLINRWDWYLLPKITLKAGGDYRYTYIDSTNDGRHTGHRGGVYLTGEYAPSGQFLLIPSIKAVTDGISVAPVPKFGILWKARETLALKNNYFRVFKFPDFDDLYWKQEGFSGNPGLKPEDGWGADLGAEYRPKSWLTFEGVFHTAWTKDSIHWSNAGGSWTPRNTGEACFFGLDARLQFKIPVSLGPVTKISPGVSYQHLLSYLLSGDLDFASDKRIPYMPRHLLGVSLDIHWNTGARRPGGSLSVSGHYESLRFADTGNIVKLDPFFLLNITVNQGIGKNITAFGSLRNALNTHYVSFAEYPMPGLTVTLGLRMNFEVPPAEKTAKPRKE